jgi:hypothetical protein
MRRGVAPHLHHRRITHPLTGRPFVTARAASAHAAFVPRGVGVDRTGAIVRETLLRKSYRPRSRQASTNPHMLRRLFRTYDADDSGGLDVDEFLRMLRDVGVQAVSEDDCRQVFRLYDTNGDGTISYDEWCAHHCRHFTDETYAVLTVPSLRLDMRHASMTAEEAATDLRKQLRRAERSAALASLTRCPPVVSEAFARGKLLDAGVGIGNEPALNTLLRGARCPRDGHDGDDGVPAVSLAAVTDYYVPSRPKLPSKRVSGRI